MAERYPWLKKRQRQARKLWAVQNTADSGGHLLLDSAVVLPGQWKLDVTEDELLRKGYLIKTPEGVVDSPNDSWKCVPMSEYLNSSGKAQKDEKPAVAPEPDPEPEPEPESDPEPELSVDPDPDSESDESDPDSGKKRRRKRKKSESGE